MTTQEFWDLAAGFTNYAVSSLGKVVDLKTSMLLQQDRNRYGYLCVTVNDGNKKIRLPVNRLIGIAFWKHKRVIITKDAKNNLVKDVVPIGIDAPFYSEQYVRT